MFIADDLAAWLTGVLADAGRRKLTALVLGSDQERELRRAAATAIALTAAELFQDDPTGDGVARVINKVFRASVPEFPAGAARTLLEALQAGIAVQFASLNTTSSATEALGVPTALLAETMTAHLLNQIMSRGATGGPLEPLSNQLSHEKTQLQGLHVEAKLDRLDQRLAEVLTRMDSASAVGAEPAGPTRLTSDLPLGTGLPFRLERPADRTSPGPPIAKSVKSTPVTRPRDKSEQPLMPGRGTAYIVDAIQDTVTAIDLASGQRGAAIAVGRFPTAMAVTPDGTTAYVTSHDDDTATPIHLATATPDWPIDVGPSPWAIVITPDGRFALVSNGSVGTVSIASLARPAALIPIRVGVYNTTPGAIAITPDGGTACVVSSKGNPPGGRRLNRQRR
jgi:hypothetical protein